MPGSSSSSSAAIPEVQRPLRQQLSLSAAYSGQLLPVSEGLQASQEKIETFFTHPGWDFFRNECLNKGGSNGTFAKKTFSYLGDGYEAVYENLIGQGILHRIDDNAKLAIPKEELRNRLSLLVPNYLTSHQKNKVLSILQQSASDPETSFLRFHREAKIAESQAFKMHILLDFMIKMEKLQTQCNTMLDVLPAQVVDLSLVQDQDGQLKLLLFSNIDSPCLLKLCDMISNQYGIPIEYPQLDPRLIGFNGAKDPSICVDERTHVTCASLKIIPNELVQEVGNNVGKYSLHCEQRLKQYLTAKSSLKLHHHANSQTSFCDENTLMRESYKIILLKFSEQQNLDTFVDPFVTRVVELHATNKKGMSGLTKELVSQFVASLFDDERVNTDTVLGVLNETIERSDGGQVQFDQKDLSCLRSQNLKDNRGNLDINSYTGVVHDMTKKWIETLYKDFPVVINNLLKQLNQGNRDKGACQLCRQALREGILVGASGSFIQDIPGEIPVQFAQSDGGFKHVVGKMEEHEFLEREQIEGKPFVFTKKYSEMALAAESRELFITSLANDLEVPPQDLTNFFKLDFFTHLKGTEVPWPLPKGRQDRTLPLDHDTIINTAMLGENRDQLDLKTLLDKRGDLNQTGALKILDTRDAESEGVSEMLAHRLGASLLNEGESDGNNAVQLEYVLDYGKQPSTYKVTLQHKRDGKLGISKIVRVGARVSHVDVFSAVSPSDREGQ